jgi:5-methylcytosine-specific restriction endonuclease McrA
MKTGTCHVCGKFGPLSFEHIPPRSTGNNHVVQIYSGDQVIKNSLTGSDDASALKYKPSQGGMGFYSLCESCNNYLGQNYEVDWVLFPVFYWVTGVTCD